MHTVDAAACLPTQAAGLLALSPRPCPTIAADTSTSVSTTKHRAWIRWTPLACHRGVTRMRKPAASELKGAMWCIFNLRSVHARGL